MSDIKKKWVEALRSGRYKQGSGRLVTVRGLGSEEDHFCCLGVLCEIDLEVSRLGEIYKFPDGGKERGSVSHGYRSKRFVDPTDVVELISMNDASRMSFSQIADYIEKYVELRD